MKILSDYEKIKREFTEDDLKSAYEKNKSKKFKNNTIFETSEGDFIEIIGKDTQSTNRYLIRFKSDNTIISVLPFSLKDKTPIRNPNRYIGIIKQNHKGEYFKILSHNEESSSYKIVFLSDGFISNAKIGDINRGSVGRKTIITKEMFIEHLKNNTEFTLLDDEFKTVSNYYNFKCSCGNITNIRASNILYGTTKYCMSCISKNNRRGSTLYDEVLELFKTKYINYTLLTAKEDFINGKTILNIKCNICGNIFNKSWTRFNSGRGCKVCSKIKMSEAKKKTFDEAKDDILKYTNKIELVELTEDNSGRTMYKLKCVCGKIFTKSMQSIKAGYYYCKNCTKYNLKGLFNIKNAEINKKEWLNKKCKIYALKVYDEDLVFYKIGITTRNIKKRMSCHFPFKYDVVYEYESNLYDCIFIENELHLKHEPYRLFLEKDFKGRTEIFYRLDMDLINNVINNKG